MNRLEDGPERSGRFLLIAAAITFLLLGATTRAGGQAVQPIGGHDGNKPVVLLETGFEPGEETLGLVDHRLVTGKTHTGEKSIEGELTKPNQAAFLRLPLDEAAGKRLALSFWVQSDDRFS